MTDHKVTEMANHLLKGGRADLAAEMWSRAAEAQPTAFNLHQWGLAAEAAGDDRAAASAFRRAAEAQPRWTAPLMGLGGVLQKRGEREAAMAQFRSALALRPNDADILVVAGICCIHRDEMQEAVPHLERATELAPDNEEAWYYLGFALRFVDGPRARQCFETALALAPDYGDAARELGYRCFLLEEFDQARQMLSLAIRLEPQDHWAHYMLGLVERWQRCLPAAAASIRSAISIQDTLPLFHSELGQVLWESGDAAAAEEAFRRALELDAEDTESHLRYGVFLKDQKRISEARHHLHSAATGDRSLVQARARAEELLRDLG